MRTVYLSFIIAIFGCFFFTACSSSMETTAKTKSTELETFILEPSPEPILENSKPISEEKYDVIDMIFVENDIFYDEGIRIVGEKTEYVESLEYLGDIKTLSDNSSDLSQNFSANFNCIDSKLYGERNKETSIIESIYVNIPQADEYRYFSSRKNDIINDGKLGKNQVLLMNHDGEILTCHGEYITGRDEIERIKALPRYGKGSKSIDYNKMPIYDNEVNFLPTNSDVFIDSKSDETCRAYVFVKNESKLYVFNNFGSGK